MPTPKRAATPPHEGAPRESTALPTTTALTNTGGRPRKFYTSEFLAEAQRRVEQTTRSMTAIAGDFGMHHSVLSQLIQRYGWVRPEGSSRRRGLTPLMRVAATVDAMVAANIPAHSRESGNPEPATEKELGPRFRGDERSEHPTSHTAIDRLEAAVLKELATVETMRASLGAEPLRPMDAERTARTLSVLTETLSKLRRLRLGSHPGSHPGGAPHRQDHDDDITDIDAFRRDLARRIDLFVASRTDGGDAARGPGALDAPAG